MSYAQTEAEVLSSLIPELEAEGYEVYVHPNRSMVPDFMVGFQPDILAFRGQEKLVVEVKRQSKVAFEGVKKIARLVEGKPDWKFRLIWLSPTSESTELPVQTKQSIITRVEKIRRLLELGDTQASFLLAWATFEAVARALNRNDFVRPQTPGRIIEVLANEGVINPADADLLRVLAKMRNRLIHGDLSQITDCTEILAFLKIIGLLVDALPEKQ